MFQFFVLTDILGVDGSKFLLPYTNRSSIDVLLRLTTRRNKHPRIRHHAMPNLEAFGRLLNQHAPTICGARLMV
jgi:hypothetical protein